jgi:DNA-binding CsgD family transcriptional regulator
VADLTSQDYERILDLACHILENPRPEPPWQLVIADVAGTLGGTVGIFADLPKEPGPGHLQVWAHSDTGQPSGRSLGNEELTLGHPIVAYLAMAQDPRPVTVSDFMKPADWRRHDVYLYSCAAFGGMHELFVPLRTGPERFRCLSVGRPTHDFTDAERAFSARLQPLLNAVGSHMTRLRHWQACAPAGEPAGQAAAYGLTGRELTVLSLLSGSLTAAAIGRRLGISARTVHKHLESLYRKLGTSDRLGTVLRAQIIGLLPSAQACRTCEPAPSPRSSPPTRS